MMRSLNPAVLTVAYCAVSSSVPPLTIAAQAWVCLVSSGACIYVTVWHHILVYYLRTIWTLSDAKPLVQKRIGALLYGIIVHTCTKQQWCVLTITLFVRYACITMVLYGAHFRVAPFTARASLACS